MRRPGFAGNEVEARGATAVKRTQFSTSSSSDPLISPATPAFGPCCKTLISDGLSDICTNSQGPVSGCDTSFALPKTSRIAATAATLGATPCNNSSECLLCTARLIDSLRLGSADEAGGRCSFVFFGESTAPIAPLASASTATAGSTTGAISVARFLFKAGALSACVLSAWQDSDGGATP